MKTRIQIGAVVLLAVLGAAACNGRWPWENPVSGPSQQTIVNIGNNPPASPTPAPAPPGCEIASVAVGVDTGGGPIPVGNQQRMDATPKGTNGANLPDSCPLPAITWSDPRGTASCFLSAQTGTFNPFIQCSAAGQITVEANVGGKVGSGTFQVR